MPLLVVLVGVLVNGVVQHLVLLQQQLMKVQNILILILQLTVTSGTGIVATDLILIEEELLTVTMYLQMISLLQEHQVVQQLLAHADGYSC